MPPDQPTPTSPVDPAAAAMVRSSANMFTKTPDVQPRTPSADEMRQANQTAGERGATVAERSAAYQASYDKPTEPSRHGEAPRADASEPAQPPGERRYTVGEGRDAVSLTYDEARGIMAKMAQEATVRATIKSPDDLRVEPSANFKPPADGIEFRIDPSNPLARAAQQWAYDTGRSQEEFSALVDIYAAQQIAQAQQIKQARDREAAELGSAAPQRIDAVRTWWRAMIGDDDAKALDTTIFTAAAVKAHEKLMLKFSNQGVGQFNGSGREPQQRGIDDATWAKMNWNERRDYQRQHAESQQQTRWR